MFAKVFSKIDKIRVIRIFLITSFIFLLVYLLKEFDLANKLNRESIENFIRPFGFWVPLVYLLLFITSMIFYVPCSIFLIVGGSIFGPVMGVFWGAIGSISSSLILFLLAKNFDYSFIRERLGSKWDLFNSKIEKNGMIYLFFIRSSAIFPFSLIGYGSAITTIRIRDYIAGTVFGCFPTIFGYAYVTPLLLISRKISFDELITLSLMILIWLVSFLSYYFLSYKKQKHLLTLKNS